MQIRVTTVRHGQRVYRYAQLVESYRRPDGKPTHRVLASLGALDEVAVENLRTALKASRQGETLVLPSLTTRPSVERSSRYLDIAVLMELWRQSGMPDRLREVLGARNTSIPEEDVVASLVLQRCVAPASKRVAEDWLPNTAIPELLGIDLSKYNNTRIHRTMGALEAAEACLQERLVDVAGEGARTALFVDATDTWFVGQGPPMAAKGKDKEGLYRRRIGLVLLCDQRGFPIRWHTLDGRYHDGSVLMDMAREVAELPWARGVPIVFDRAVGNAHTVDELSTSGLRFVTSVPGPEFKSCRAGVPWQALAQMQEERVSEGEPRDMVIQRLCKIALKAGFERISDTRFLLDIGVFDKAMAFSSRVSEAQQCLRWVEIIEEYAGRSLKEVGKRIPRSERSLFRLQKLVSLDARLRKRIQAGEGDGLFRSDLLAIAERSPETQVAAFEEAIQRRPASRPVRARKTQGEPPDTIKTRGVVVFNPEKMLEDRENEETNEARIEELIKSINEKLSSKKSTRTNESVIAKIDAAIREVRLGGVLKAQIETHDGQRSVTLSRSEDQWLQRRSSDGLSLLVAHPSLVESAANLVKLYFSKDIIEKDFHAIKSFVKLRPVHHRSDIKVRAHVTICVLALLLLRMFDERLRSRSQLRSSQAALDLLEPVRLNFVAHGEAYYYTVTKADKNQNALLKKLGMEYLVDDTRMSAILNPR